MIKTLPMSMIEVLLPVIPDNDPQVQSSEIPAYDSVKIEQADENGVLPNGELANVKYMREISYWSPPKYRGPKKRKTTKKRQCKKSNQQPKKRKTKKDIPAITNKFREVPPVVDEKGERSEVQVFEEFNPDEILYNLYKPPTTTLSSLYRAHDIWQRQDT